MSESRRERPEGFCPAAYRCFVEGRLEVGRLDVPPEEARHLARVRRIGPGEEVTVLNGRGRLGEAVVETVGKRELRLEVRRVRETGAPTCPLILAVGALKQSAWDELLVHAVELGVTKLLRVSCVHAVSDPGGDRLEAKGRRWRERMIQACKQSVNPWLPVVETVESVDAAVAALSGVNWQVLADLAATEPMWRVPAPGEGAAAVWVGPEGDFTGEERQKIVAGGAFRVRLGPRILRAETAALSLVAALRLGVGRPLQDIADLGNAVEDVRSLD